MLFESILKDIEVEPLIEIFKEYLAEMITLTDDDSILCTQIVERSKSRSEHRLRRNITKATFFIEALQSCFYRSDIANDTVFWKIGQHIFESLQGILDSHSIDEQLGLKLFDFFELCEAIGIIYKAQLLRIGIIDCCLVIETQNVIEERAHLSGS